MTTKERQSTTEPRHWSNETAAAVQAAMEARALMLATARALGLPDERVEDAPQEAERLRRALAELRQQIIFITTHDARTSTRLAQAEARVRWLEAALHKVLDEAHGDCDWDIVTTAARGALEGVNDE